MHQRQFAVRVATVEDAEGIADVHVTSWQSTYRGHLPQSFLDGLSTEQRTPGWVKDIEQGTLTTHVALDESGTIGGFVSTGPCAEDTSDPTVGELWAIYVRPELLGQGIGTSLHEAGIAALATRFRDAILWVLEQNARARSFYERMGWHADGGIKHPAIGDTQITELRYRRHLGTG